ncbi:MAG: hypothetical protein F7B11_04170 [Caldisphaeraceae archaeon]|nr:hypothetical protein [Caldisphaeraceae archaeon]MEB2793118.1 hypothetical protein [Caldisphaeraceae archaeon]MEB3691434.1 hypothetical protein [Caldisphaeraceae archaeon]MEB3798152.1 hypothetical protein [Caldisphaeraceae archaeon]
MNPFSGQGFAYQAILLFIVLIVVVLLTIRQANELKRISYMQKRPKFVTVEDCNGMVSTRDYKEGDFVGLVEGPCDNDGNLRRIVGIYAITEEKKKKGLI